ncbi:uncharacterized protein LOC134466062 [Engraulis encrasicolus]|uniref:uncharacterized protein LOC134466062 n=1 Tax=Engraulis encrasicolus TaxID=184585 RepID=UPI002FCF5D0C
MERVSTANTEEREEPVCQEASQDGLGRVSPATSPILMEATGFADAQEQVVDASQTAPPVETAAHATSPIEKYTLIGCQLYDECLDAAVGMITKDSSHSSPVPGDETGHGVYLETDTVTGVTEEDDFVCLHLPSPPPDTPQDNSVDSPPLAESLQTATMAFESATPDVIVESEETVAHEQSANTAEASDISAESPAFTTAESTEIGINTMECCPSEASQDASSLETMADCAAVSPVTHVEPEFYSSPDDATSPSDGACTPTTDTEAVTVSCVHHVDDNVTDTEKTADVMTSVDSSKTPVSPGN